MRFGLHLADVIESGDDLIGGWGQRRRAHPVFRRSGRDRSDALQEKGDHANAFSAANKDLEIFAEIAKRDPQNAVWQRSLATAYSRVASVRRRAGNLGTAASFYSKDVEISRRLASTDPSNSVAQRALAIALHNFAALEFQRGKRGRARQLAKEAHAIFAVIVATHPDHQPWTRDRDRTAELVAKL